MSNTVYNKATFNGQTIIDLSQDTVTSAEHIVAGRLGHLADGRQVTGTASGGDGGSSPWIKVAENTFTVNTSDTSSITVGTLTCDQSIWTRDKLIYVRVRDTEGPTQNRFYGTDTFINQNGHKQNTVYSDMCRWVWKYISPSTGYNLRIATGTTVYGIAPGGSISSTSPYDIKIDACYHSSYSGTINSTYKVEVYLLDSVGEVPIFE